MSWASHEPRNASSSGLSVVIGSVRPAACLSRSTPGWPSGTAMCEFAHLGHLDRLLELASREAEGQVGEGLAGGGDRDAVGARRRPRPPWPMDHDRRGASNPACTGDGDVDPGGGGGTDAPERRGAPVAQRGAVAARHDGGEPPALARDDRVADGVDAAVEPVKPPARDSPARSASRSKPSARSCVAAHDAILPAGQVRRAAGRVGLLCRAYRALSRPTRNLAPLRPSPQCKKFVPSPT